MLITDGELGTKGRGGALTRRALSRLRPPERGSHPPKTKSLLTSLFTENRRSSKGLRIGGYSLLWVGFLCLSTSAALLPINVQAAATRLMSEGLPNKESYTRVEIVDALSGLARSNNQELPSIFVLALLMLIGGILLARSTSTTNEPNDA